MSGYGFRLYTVKLVNGSKKSKAIDFDKCGMGADEHVSVWVRRALEHLETFLPFTGMPMLQMAEDETELPAMDTYCTQPKRGDYRIRFTSHTKTPMTRIRFAIQYGRTGKVSVGVQDEGALPLSHIPTGDVYRGILYLPAAGAKGLLALESVPSAPNPSRMLNAWLARAGVDLKEQDEAALKRLPAEEAKGLRPQPYKLNFRQYPNIERIEKAVASSDAAKVVLKRQHHDGGGVAQDEDMVVTSTLRTAPKKTKAGKLAAGLVRMAFKKLEDDEEPVSLDDLEELLDGEFEGVEWTEGYIQIDDETGLKKIGLEHIDKFFVYPTGSMVQQKATAFEQSVAAEIVGLQAALGLELDLS